MSDRPIVIIEVRGGVADVTTINAEDEVDIIEIDWDNIKEGGTFTAAELQAMYNRIEGILPNDDGDDEDGLKSNILSDLTEAIAQANLQELHKGT